MSTDGGSNYNVTKTTTIFRAYHGETSGITALEYQCRRRFSTINWFSRFA
jgi:hypothetical protein